MSNSPKLAILNQISESQILKHYLPDFELGKSANYRSPFAEKDENPSLNIYQKDGKLLFKSHNTGHQGDVFQFVADLKGINCKTDFQAVIAEIQKDLGITYDSSGLNEKRNVKISYEKQPTDLHAYFASLGIAPNVLERYQVRQVKYHEFVTSKGKVCKFDYRRLNQLAVCYQVGESIKVYFPKIEGKQEKQFGYKDQTTEDIFGLEQLPGHNERLFIAAGEKDCLVLNAYEFPAIAFQSENTMPTTAQMKTINALADSICIVYDNDEPGKNAARKLAEKTGWNRLPLPEGFKDVAEWLPPTGRFKTLEYIETAIQSAPVPKEGQGEAAKEIYTIFHQTEEFLNKYYDFRYNTISLDIEYSEKGKNNFGQVNENQLYIRLNKSGVRIEINKLISILKSDFVAQYNPLTYYFQSLPEWDKTDHIARLSSHLISDRPIELDTQFRKWLVRCVHSIMEPGYYNKQAFILVHNKQNSGKTSFCRFLCPPALSNYIAENISDDKDSRIALVKNFLINLDELSSLARHEINSLKALFSKDCINERLPYDRKNSIIPRVANFIGSTNMGEFLTDETGSVRWLCFEIQDINWDYRKTIDINKVWAHAYYLYRSGFAADMNTLDIAENESRNAKFQQRSIEAEIIPTLLEPGDSTNPMAVFMTATDVMQYLQIWSALRLNRVMIGRAMPSCGFPRVKDSRSDRYGYWAVKLKGNDLPGF